MFFKLLFDLRVCVGLMICVPLNSVYFFMSSLFLEVGRSVGHFLLTFIRCLLRCDFDFPFPRILFFFLPTAKNVLNIPRPKTSVGFVLSLNFIISYATSFANSIKNGLNNHHRLGLANCLPSFTNTKLFMFIQLLILCCVTKIFATTSILEWSLP